MVLKLEDIKVGMKLRVRKFNKRPWYWNSDGLMDKYMGQVVTVEKVEKESSLPILIKEDHNWYWDPSDFEYVKCIFANTRKD